MTGADFSPKPPIVARGANEQAGTFLLPPATASSWSPRIPR